MHQEQMFPMVIPRALNFIYVRFYVKGMLKVVIVFLKF